MNNLKKAIAIPTELQHFQIALNQSAEQVALLKPFVQPTLLHESKFAGFPYLPKTIEYPKDEQHDDMFFLAQLNFSEIQLASPFPKDGIVQFYISQQSYNKMKSSSENGSFKVQYLAVCDDYDDLIQDFSYLNELDFSQFPIKQEMKLQIETQFEPVSAMDYRLENYFNPDIMNSSITLDERSFQDVYLEHYLAAEHKIGGYPYFINDDFRTNAPFLQQYDTLLLQIVSNDEQNIMWGDSGIMSFFINSKKLKQLDFSDVYLHLEEY